MRIISQIMLYLSVTCIALAVGMSNGTPAGLYTFGCSVLLIVIAERSFRYLDAGQRRIY